MSRDSETTSDVSGDFRLGVSEGHVMTTYVIMTFDALQLNASTQLNNATLSLHNNPVIHRLSDTVNIYPNKSQIIEITVRRTQRHLC